MGFGGGLLPPAGRFEVDQGAASGLDPVLRTAVADDVKVAVGGVDHLEGAGRIRLSAAVIGGQGMQGVVTEADIGQRRLGACRPAGPDDRRAGRVRPAVKTLAASRVTSKPSALRRPAKSPLSS